MRELIARVTAKRTAENLSIREVGRQSGVAFSLLAKSESQPDRGLSRENERKLRAWLGEDASSIPDDAATTSAPPLRLSRRTPHMTDTVNVTPVDREAYLAFNGLPVANANDVRAGVWDETTGMQIIAAHRLAAEKAERKAVVAWLRDLSNATLTPSIVAFFGDPWGDDGQRLLGVIADCVERIDHHKQD